MITKHPTLIEKEYYDCKNVGSGRKDKVCEHCKKEIKIGTAHHVHYFTPDPNFVPDPTIPVNPNQTAFRSFPTHKECSDDFISSLK